MHRLVLEVLYEFVSASSILSTGIPVFPRYHHHLPYPDLVRSLLTFRSGSKKLEFSQKKKWYPNGQERFDLDDGWGCPATYTHPVG
jgi:hypothetical protein